MLSAIRLMDSDGMPSTLEQYRADPLVVILVRYFGCLPCQQFLTDVERVRDQLPHGAAVMAIGGSADYQARFLRDEKGVTMPLLLDAQHQLRDAAGVGDLTPLQMNRWEGWKRYARAWRSGFRLQRPTKDARKAPGIVILDAEFRIIWTYTGQMLGDYPTVPELLVAVRRVRAGPDRDQG